MFPSFTLLIFIHCVSWSWNIMEGEILWLPCGVAAKCVFDFTLRRGCCSDWFFLSTYCAVSLVITSGRRAINMKLYCHSADDIVHNLYPILIGWRFELTLTPSSWKSITVMALQKSNLSVDCSSNLKVNLCSKIIREHQYINQG